jgi:hypothetical protein
VSNDTANILTVAHDFVTQLRFALDVSSVLWSSRWSLPNLICLQYIHFLCCSA